MNDDVNVIKARIIYYNFFSKFLIYPNNMSGYNELVSLIAVLKQAPLDANCEQAFMNLELKLPKDSNEVLLREFDEIFSNPASYSVKTTASFFNEGIENGKKKIEMLQFLAKTTIRRDEKSYFENEDSIGFIVTVLFELLEKFAQGETRYENTIHCMFEQILNTFVDEFIQELYSHEKSDIYKDVAVILSAFIAFERLYLDVAKPAMKEKATKKDATNRGISKSEQERRARNKALKALGPKV